MRKCRYGASSREKSNKYIIEKIDHVELVLKHSQGFSGGPMVRTPRFHGEGPDSFPGQGTKIPQEKKTQKHFYVGEYQDLTLKFKEI